MSKCIICEMVKIAVREVGEVLLAFIVLGLVFSVPIGTLYGLFLLSVHYFGKQATIWIGVGLIIVFWSMITVAAVKELYRNAKEKC